MGKRREGDDASERSPGGSPIKRYEPRDREIEPAVGDPDLIEGLTAHMEGHLGPEVDVFHEVVSDVVHIDLLHTAPLDDFPFHTLMSCGMSERPMPAPAELPDERYAEVMLRLPPDWPLEQQAFEDESVYWPLRTLKFLARALQMSTTPGSATGTPSPMAIPPSDTLGIPISVARFC